MEAIIADDDFGKKRFRGSGSRLRMESSRQMLFRVDKGAIRAVLVSLEARTGRRSRSWTKKRERPGKG